MSFANKVVLVTGSSSGIGASTALLFAEKGAKLILVGRNKERLQDVASKVENKKGIKPLAIVADISNDAGVEKIAKEALAVHQKLDVLVNNAGLTKRTTFENTNMEDFDVTFNTNVRGTYNLTRLLLQALIAAKGNIINVSSIAGLSVTTGSVPYSMSKAALDHFTRLLAFELAPKGVRVNTVSPGITKSNFVLASSNMSPDQYNEFLSQCVHNIPMGKVCEPEDIAYMIVHVASEESRLITGAVIPIDGGLQFTLSTNIYKNHKM